LHALKKFLALNFSSISGLITSSFLYLCSVRGRDLVNEKNAEIENLFAIKFNYAIDVINYVLSALGRFMTVFLDQKLDFFGVG
jgi:hypothetical protein